MTDQTFLTGHLLIAMPAMQDPNFARTVTYICEHSEQGALGIVINRPLDIDLGNLLTSCRWIPRTPTSLASPSCRAGPCTRSGASCSTSRRRQVTPNSTRQSR